MRLVDNQANIIALGESHYFSNSLKRVSPKEVSKVTHENIKKLYKKVINRNGLTAWLIGNYSNKNFDDLSKLILSVPKLEPSVAKWLPQRTLTKSKDNKVLALILRKKDMTQCNISLRYYFPTLGKLNEIEETQYALLSEIFSSSGGIVGNDRFSKAMRADSGISYSPHAYFNSNVLYPNTNLSAFYLNFQSPNERLVEAINLAKKTWETFATKGVGKEELDHSRIAMMNRVLASELTVFDKSEEIINQLVKGKVPNKTPIESTLVNLEQMKNLTAMNDALNKLSSEKQLTVLVIMGNPDEGQIALLKSEKDVNLVNVVDFNSFIGSF